jgi:hypothetical protein
MHNMLSSPVQGVDYDAVKNARAAFNREADLTETNGEARI